MKPVEVVRLFEDEVFIRTFVDFYISSGMDWQRIEDVYGFDELAFREAMNKNNAMRTKFYDAICDRSLHTAIETLPTALQALTTVLSSFDVSDENVRLKAVSQLMTIMKELRPKQTKEKESADDSWEDEIDSIYEAMKNESNKSSSEDN